MTAAARLEADLSTIIRTAEQSGTLQRLKSVAVYFDEVELRTIVHALRKVAAEEREFEQTRPHA